MTGTGPAVLIMAKAPRPGTVKTRLHPLLGPHGCARLQAYLLRRAASVARELAPQAASVAFDPPDARPEIARLVPAEVTLFPQSDGDLGQRLAAASGVVLATRPGPLVVIGTDAPTLTVDLLAQAVAELIAGRDAVFGPAYDGGYYLVGLSRPLAALFALDPKLWGGNSVLAASLAAATAAGLNVGLLPPLRDLDVPADAQALRDDPLLPADIAALLEV